MSLRKRGLTVGAVVAGAALVLSACSGGGGDTGGGGGDGGSGGQISMAIEAPTYGLSPANCYDLYCAQVDQVLYTGLLVFKTNDQGQMVPENSELTESITASDDKKTYTIKIKPGWKFTNGEEITAQTFVDTFNFAANAGNGQQLGFIFGPSQLNVVGFDATQAKGSKDAKMSGMKVVDNTTFTIELVEPIQDTLFKNFMAGPQIYPMPKAAFEDPKAFETNPIGNGPYKLQGAWENATGGTVVKNADYQGTAGKVDQIEFKVYASEDAQWADLQSDNVDIMATIPQGKYSEAEAVLGDRYINKPGGLQFSYYGFQVDDPTYKDKNIRIAVARAINTPLINEKIYANTRQAGTSFAPETIAGGGTDICGTNCQYDAAAAKQLLEQAGGLKGEVHVTQLAKEPGDVSEAICNQIQANLGVKCVIDIYKDFGTLAAAQQEGEVPDGTLVGSGWIADNPTIHNMVTANWTCDNYNNYTGYCNKDVDRLLQEGVSAADEAEQIAKWQEAEKIILTDFWGWPFQMRNQVGGYSSRVAGVDISPGGFVDLATVTVTS